MQKSSLKFNCCTKPLYQISKFNDALVVSDLAEFLLQHEESVGLNLCSCHQNSLAIMDFPGDTSNPGFFSSRNQLTSLCTVSFSNQDIILASLEEIWTDSRFRIPPSLVIKPQNKRSIPSLKSAKPSVN